MRGSLGTSLLDTRSAFLAPWPPRNDYSSRRHRRLDLASVGIRTLFEERMHRTIIVVKVNYVYYVNLTILRYDSMVNNTPRCGWIYLAYPCPRRRLHLGNPDVLGRQRPQAERCAADRQRSCAVVVLGADGYTCARADALAVEQLQ